MESAVCSSWCAAHILSLFGSVSLFDINLCGLFNAKTILVEQWDVYPTSNQAAFEVGLKVNTKVYLDVLKSVVIPWCNQVTGGRHWAWQQDSAPAHNRLGFRRIATTLYPSFTGPLLQTETAGLLRLVIRRENHQHDLPQHQSQPDRRHPPSIHWAPAGACGKGMPPVPDPYRGGDWGWRQLHWINVSSTT